MQLVIKNGKVLSSHSDEQNVDSLYPEADEIIVVPNNTKLYEDSTGDIDYSIQPSDPRTKEQTEEWQQSFNKLTAKKFLDSTDWKVVRHLDERELNQGTTLTEQEFNDLLQERKQARETLNI